MPGTLPEASPVRAPDFTSEAYVRGSSAASESYAPSGSYAPSKIVRPVLVGVCGLGVLGDVGELGVLGGRDVDVFGFVHGFAFGCVFVRGRGDGRGGCLRRVRGARLRHLRQTQIGDGAEYRAIDG